MAAREAKQCSVKGQVSARIVVRVVSRVGRPALLDDIRGCSLRPGLGRAAAPAPAALRLLPAARAPASGPSPAAAAAAGRLRPGGSHPLLLVPPEAILYRNAGPEI
eukprot:scaffold244189_cov36-Prasinocladus_malaysianus.AAC.1